MSRLRASVPPKQQLPEPGRRGQPWVVLVAALVLSACTTSQIDQIPHSVGGLPEGAPARPAAPAAFPAVHDMPPQRAQPLLDEEQQKRLEGDLLRARNRQAPEQAKAKPKDQSKDQPKPQNTGQKPSP
jgi:hypothetical protein